MSSFSHLSLISFNDQKLSKRVGDFLEAILKQFLTNRSVHLVKN